MALNSKNILIAFVSLLTLIIFGLKFLDSVPQSLDQIYKTDYPNYYFAGKRLLSGERIYSPINQEVEREFGWKEYIAYTADTPLTVIIMSPLSLLQAKQGAGLLNITSILVLCLSIYLVSRTSGYSLLVSILFISLSLSSIPFLFLLYKCHMESLILLLGVAGFLSLKKSSPKLAGFFWGFAAAIKVFPMLWLLPYLFDKNRKSVFYTGVGSAVVLTGISFLVVGYENFHDFIFLVLPMSERWLGSVGNYSIISFLTALGAKVPLIIAGPIFGMILTLLLVEARKNTLNDEKNFTLTTASALLISPLSWLNYFILIFPSLIFLSRRYSYFRVTYYLPLLVLFSIFWGWPDFISTPWLWLTIVLSFMPMFALVSILFHFQKKL